MAYLMHDRRNKDVQYSPNEKDFTDYTRCVLQQNQKQQKRNLPCPIYIHEYCKIPNSCLYNKCTFSNIDPFIKTKPPKYENPKKVLNKIEETYWATWKPTKCQYKEVKPEKPIKTLVKPQSNPNKNETEKDNTPYGDVAQQLIQFFSKPNFSPSGSDSDKTEHEPALKDFPSTQSKPKISPFPLTPSLDEPNKDHASTNAINKSNSSEWILTTVDNRFSSGVESDETLKVSHVSIEEENGGVTTKLKLIKHNDSFIINKRKKEEVKEPHYQQPKCIKLYKKSGANNYVRGGSYPLKSIRKKENASKGNFKLGPPGQLVVTGGSYNKKVVR